MRNIIILFIAASILFGCSSDNDFEKGKRMLEQQGYTNVVNIGYEFFCCSDSDNFSTGFVAHDANGNVVSGCFCSGVAKGITIRFK